VDSATIDLTIIIFVVEDPEFPLGGGVGDYDIIFCCWGMKGLVNIVGWEGDPPHSIY
jgi:hypothetical protein